MRKHWARWRKRRFLAFLSTGFLAILGLIAFVASDLLLSLHGFHPNMFWGSFLVFFFALTAIFPFFSLVVSRKYPSYRHRLALYTGSLAILLLSITMINALIDPRDKVSHFKSITGNCSNFSGVLWKTSKGRETLQDLAAFLPPTYQYSYYLAEETCRGIKLKQQFERPRPQICSEVDRQEDPVECFKTVITQATESAPLTTTGLSLSNSVGTMVALKQNVSDIESSVDLLDLSVTGYEIHQRRSSVESLMSVANESQLDAIPEEILQTLVDSRNLSKHFDQVLENLEESERAEMGILIALDRVMAHHYRIGVLDHLERWLPKLERQIRKARRPAKGDERLALDDQRARVRELKKRIRGFRRNLQQDNSLEFLERLYPKG